MQSLMTWGGAGLGSLAVLWVSVWEWSEAEQTGFALVAGVFALLVGAVAAALVYARTHSGLSWLAVYLGIGLLLAVLIGEYFRLPTGQTKIYQGRVQKIESCQEDHHGVLQCEVTLWRQ